MNFALGMLGTPGLKDYFLTALLPQLALQPVYACLRSLEKLCIYSIEIICENENEPSRTRTHDL